MILFFFIVIYFGYGYVWLRILRQTKQDKIKGSAKIAMNTPYSRKQKIECTYFEWQLNKALITTEKNMLFLSLDN